MSLNETYFVEQLKVFSGLHPSAATDDDSGTGKLRPVVGNKMKTKHLSLTVSVYLHETR
jgi:hypothetical protein